MSTIVLSNVLFLVWFFLARTYIQGLSCSNLAALMRGSFGAVLWLVGRRGGPRPVVQLHVLRMDVHGVLAWSTKRMSGFCTEDNDKIYNARRRRRHKQRDGGLRTLVAEGEPDCKREERWRTQKQKKALVAGRPVEEKIFAELTRLAAIVSGARPLVKRH